jgi:NAD-dependent DNA ligase
MNTRIKQITCVVRNRELTKSFTQLAGIVSGMLADGHLHDLEVLYLQTWLTENSQIREIWPASVIWQRVSDALRDGVIDEEERKQLVECLNQLSCDQFADTGSATPEPIGLPIEDCVTIAFPGSSFCFTGNFVYGTRARCERATLAAGGSIADNVTRNCNVLVIGTMVAAAWTQTSYGRKIEAAVRLQEKGEAIEIISERRWTEALISG